MPRLPLVFSAALLLAIPTMFARPAAAAWPNDPAINVPVVTATNDQYLGTQAIVSDGAGGVIIAWQDNRVYWDIYAQRINAAGFPVWAANGVPICTAANYQDRPTIVTDGAGGAIIVWSDARTGGALGYDVYAQRVNAAGVTQWTTDGVPVAVLAADQYCYNSGAVADGNGGVIMTWYDTRNQATTGADIYAQRLNASGVPQWAANGVVVCNAVDTQNTPVAATDGAGGAIIAWPDYRTQASTNCDVYAQRVSASGAMQWSANGIAVCSVTADQQGVNIIADGAGGAIVSWYDLRNANYDIYASRVSASGVSQWAGGGVPVCLASGSQYNAVLSADGSGGAIIAWEDYRNANGDIYAQHMSAAGFPVWSVNGLALCTNTTLQQSPSIVADGAGGAVIAWQDQRIGNSSTYSDLYAQRVNGAGSMLWASDGNPISTAPYRQAFASLVNDGVGGTVAAFMDLRSGVNYHVSAQRIEQFGKLGNPEPVITSVLDVPNDQGGHVRLSWAPSYLDPANDYDMSVYDIYHSIPPNLAQQAQQAVRTGAAREVRAGEAPLAGRPSYLFTSQGAQAYAWEYVNSVNPAHFLSSYGSNQATTGDSVGGSNPTTAFMVVARGYTGKYWLSAPASGYSVDNIPPKTPAPFTGQYAAGSTKLHWDRNSEADLAGYKLYRGNNAAFVPGAGNLVSTLADTGYVDAAAAPYIYKLTAVDSHGNESPVATLTPTGTLGVGDGAALELAFAAPSPNPARGSTTLEFTLPQAGHVRLSVFDAAGRRVQTLHDGEMAAGAHREAFALRDDAGRDLAAGLYLVRLETAGRVITRRLAAVR